MFSEFQKAQAERDARILAAYGVNPYIGDMKTTIEKGGSKGEGSRGGKVIGHTRSGKAIYDTHDHPSHAKFTDEDHMDAMEAHKGVEWYSVWAERREHASNQRKGHAGKITIGRTTSGKSIHYMANHPHHADFTVDDHKDAVVAHGMEIARIRANKESADKENYHIRQIKDHNDLAAGYKKIEKAGEGQGHIPVKITVSRGGKTFLQTYWVNSQEEADSLKKLNFPEINGKFVDFVSQEDKHRMSSYRENGEKAAGSFGWFSGTGNNKKYHDANLVKLDDFDKELVSKIKLKDSEIILRYQTGGQKKDGSYMYTPLIKLNKDNGRIYFATQKSWDTGEIEFEPAGIKADYIKLIKP